MDEKERSRRFKKSKINLLVASLILNALIITTFLTSSPNVSPASSWTVAANKVLYRIGLKPSDLSILHKKASRLDSEDCIACHGNMKASKLQLHRIHLTSPLVNFSCNNCHTEIVLKRKSKTQAIQLVNVGFCRNCHSRFSGFNEKSAMKPVDFQADCTLCHTGKHAFRHAKPYLSHIISPRECKVCHGGLVLPWRPEHTKEDWVEKHGKFALKDSDKCMSCHEYGLAFCEDCHSRKPSSHKPKDVWLQAHRKQAKQDVQACYTCHKPEMCRECHIGHTTNWKQIHYQFVLSEGTKMCENCHSSIFCESCHVSYKVPEVPEEVSSEE